MSITKKRVCFLSAILLSVVLISFLFFSCSQDVAIETEQFGSIQGHAFFSNGDDHSGIVLTLDKTDGLRAISQSDGSKTIVAMASSNEEGFFTFNNLEPGTYTIYASSNDSIEKAVSTNVVVRGTDPVTAEDLHLTATGSICGYVTLDGQKSDNMGFLVFLAGTSFVSVTNDAGYYCITGVPSGTEYQLVVSKGGFVSSDVSLCVVVAHGISNIGVKDIASEELFSDYSSMIWKGSFSEAPENPKKLWAYFNNTDGCSYIFDGTEWTLLAARGAQGDQGIQGETGEQGPQGEQGLPGENGAAGSDGVSITWKGSLTETPAKPQLYWAYFNQADGCSYIFDGTEWTLLAAKGAKGDQGIQGETGEQGPQGEQGNPGETGVAGADGQSIIWMGSHASADELENPKNLWVYFNSTDGCSYIFDGTKWTLLAQKGEKGEQGIQGETGPQGPQGEQGPQGPQGETGTSITWLGNYDSAPENPVLFSAYYNTVDGCSYLYLGDSWTLLSSSIKDEEVTIYIPENTTTVDGLSALYSVSNIVSVIIPYGVEVIEENAFRNCTSLRYIEIPGSVTRIGKSAFENCSSLQEMVLPTFYTFYTFHQSGSSSNVSYKGNSNTALSNSNGIFGGNVPSSLEKITIIASEIPEGAFKDIKSLKEVSIFDSVSSIGKEAFSGCSSLKGIIIPDSVQSIGYGAFSGCSSLIDMTIPFVGNSKDRTNGFFGYIFGADSYTENSEKVPSGLTTVIIENSGKFDPETNKGTIIWEHAFDGCIGIETIKLPANTLYINDYAFANCEDLSVCLSDYMRVVVEASSPSIFENTQVLFETFHVHLYDTEWSFDENRHWRDDICGHNTISKLAIHTWDVGVTIPATCTTDGEEIITCTICGATKTVTIPATGHAIDDNHTCFICGEFVPFIGPAGGYVFYDCDADNESGNADGLISTECGWRYLEAAPADLRLINGVPTVDASVNGYTSASTGYQFGFYWTSYRSPDYLYVNGTTEYNPSDCTGINIGTGKRNTQLLVNVNAYVRAHDGDYYIQSGDYAAMLCDSLVYTVGGVTYDDWFLPSIDELKMMNTNLATAGLGGFSADFYWSSSEYNGYRSPNGGGYYAFSDYLFDYSSGSWSAARSTEHRVRPVRAFILNEDGSEHNHSFSESWTYNEEYHWHPATCGHVDLMISGKGEHIWDDGVTTVATCTTKGCETFTCLVCGATKTTFYTYGDHVVDGNHICTICRNLVPFIGPAGGYVFYDCDADNESGNADGLISTECGWRYLEAAPADLRLVNGVPTVDASVNGYTSASASFVFGTFKPYLYVNGTNSYNSSDCTGFSVGLGKSNTQMLVSAFGDVTYSSTLGDDETKTSNYAARLCDILTYTVNGVIYDDWFLPSKDELNLMYESLHDNSLGNFANDYYWTSSECDYQPYNACYQDFDSGKQLRILRGYPYRVRAVRSY